MDLNLVADNKMIVELGCSRENKSIYVLFDSGAVFPVWCSSVSKLFQCYDCNCTNIQTIIKGFGGMSSADVYDVKEIPIKDIKFTNVLLVFSRGDFGVDLILPYTFFGSLNFSNVKYDTYNGVTTVQKPGILKFDCLRTKYEIVSNTIMTNSIRNSAIRSCITSERFLVSCSVKEVV